MDENDKYITKYYQQNQETAQNISCGNYYIAALFQN
jgi:hypothetical protein